MKITEKLVLKALSTVEDPDLKKDLVTLGMISDIKIEDQKVLFRLTLTTPACPLKELLRSDCTKAIQKAFGDAVEVEIEMDADVTAAKSNLAGADLPNVKNIIAISSGKGGVGKSTVSANLAISLAETGAKVGLIDADIFGPSIPVMFGLEEARPAMVEEDGKTKIIPIQKHGVKIISIGFLTDPSQAIVWRGPMASSALRQFFSDCEWGELDYLLVDLPPGTSDIHLTLVQAVPVTGAVVVTTPQKVALADAKKGLAMFRQPQINVPVLGIVENMAYFTPEELPDNKYYIFGKDGGKQFAEEYKVQLLGQIPLVQSIRESGDEGTPAVLKNDLTSASFKQVAETLARQIAIRNANMSDTQRVEVKI